MENTDALKEHAIISGGATVTVKEEIVGPESTELL